MAGLQDWAVRLAELLDIPQSEALELTRRIVPTLEIESISDRPTTRVPGLVGALSWGGDQMAAVAGQNSHIQLLNPANSGVELHLDRAIISTTVAGIVAIRRLDSGLANLIATKAFEDFRRTGDPASEVRTANAVGLLGTLLGQMELLASTPFELKFDQLVLAEANGIAIAPAAVNVGITILWFWREL